MLNPRLVSCQECTTIEAVLSEIDCYLTKVGKDLYNNVVYMLGKAIPACDIADVLTYKRILVHRAVDDEYAGDASLSEIVSKVKMITKGCVSRCMPCVSCYPLEGNAISITTTTTSTALPETTTTTTTIII